MYLNLLFNKHFGGLNKILQKCISKKDSKTKEIKFIDSEINQLSKEELKNISSNFKTKYKDTLNIIKKNIYNNISKSDNAKIIFTKFLDKLINKYSIFLNLL